MNKRELGLVIRTMRKSRDMTQAYLGSLLNVAPSTVGMWEAGKNEPDLETIEALADVFNVPISALTGAAPSLPSENFSQIPNILPITTRKIPLIGEIACGTPSEPSEEFEVYVTAGTDIRADFALRAHGDSMTGARIMDGDIVFIRRQPTVDDGEIAAVLIDGETTLKRIRHVSGQLLLLPENPAFSPIIASSSQDVRILGRAIAFQSDVR